MLKAADQALETKLRGVLAGGEDDASLATPPIDGDDQTAPAALVEARARDAHAMLGVLAGRPLPPCGPGCPPGGGGGGQDLEPAGDGSFRIARKVAADRVSATVDPDARHGHKTSARGFDGSQGHAWVDPDSERILATAATAGNRGDPAAPELLAEPVEQVQGDPPAPTAGSDPGDPAARTPTVDGDSASGTGPLLEHLHAASIDPPGKLQAASRPRDPSPRTSSGSILPPVP